MKTSIRLQLESALRRRSELEDYLRRMIHSGFNDRQKQIAQEELAAVSAVCVELTKRLQESGP